MLPCFAAQAAPHAFQAALSPAHTDATSALRHASGSIEAAGVKGLLATHRLEFSFRTAAGTCPPGTNDGSYCVGAAGRLLLTLTLHVGTKHAVEAFDVRVRFAPRSKIRVKVRIDDAGIAALDVGRREKSTVTATLHSEAIISAASYYAEKRTIKIS